MHKFGERSLREFTDIGCAEALRVSPKLKGCLSGSKQFDTSDDFFHRVFRDTICIKRMLSLRVGSIGEIALKANIHQRWEDTSALHGLHGLERDTCGLRVERLVALIRSLDLKAMVQLTAFKYTNKGGERRVRRIVHLEDEELGEGDNARIDLLPWLWLVGRHST